MLHHWGKTPLPRPDKIHHVIEDFLTDWTAQLSHIFPLRRFLETILNRDLRHHYAEECLLLAITSTALPLHCNDMQRAPYLMSSGL